MSLAQLFLPFILTGQISVEQFKFIKHTIGHLSNNTDIDTVLDLLKPIHELSSEKLLELVELDKKLKAQGK